MKMIDMELYPPNDNKVINLLSKLKKLNGMYPPDIYAARRQTYLRQVASVGVGIGAGVGIKNAIKGGNGAIGTVATITSKILEAVLITAIVAEVGAAAYLYRNKIIDVIKTYTGLSNVREVAPSVINTSSNNSGLVEATKTPFATPSDIPTYTLVPPIVIINNNVNPSVTPKPGGDNGNHYGNTPKPERTKDKGNNNGNNNNSDNKKDKNKKP